MAKAKRGLLLSVLTLLIAIAVTATSTYAWFAANSSVSANNMQVTVTSNTSFLVIKAAGVDAEAPTYSTIGEAMSQTAVAASTTSILPAKHDATNGWQYAAGTNYSNGAAANGQYVNIQAANLSGYAVHYVFYLALAATTQSAASNLKITSMTVSDSTTGHGFSGAISAYLELSQVGGSNNPLDTKNITDISGVTFTDTTGGAASHILLSTMALNTIYKLDAWVYLNGDNTIVTSANATTANLGGYAVSMSLAVD